MSRSSSAPPPEPTAEPPGDPPSKADASADSDLPPSFPADALEALDLLEVLGWMAHKASTPRGRRRLLEATPHMDPEAREQRRRRGQEALDALRAEEMPGFAGSADVEDLAAWAAKRLLEGEELLALADHLDLVRLLAGWAAAHPQWPELARALLAAPDCRALREQLRASLGRRGEILDQAHAQLGGVRKTVRRVSERRARRIEELAVQLHRRGALRQRLPVQRGDRLLLAVKATEAGRARGVVHDRSHSGDTLFIEPGEILELSNQISEARALERRLEEEVLTALTRAVLDQRHDLILGERLLAHADLAFACARWAAETDAVYPELLHGRLKLRAARHPLLLRQLGAAATESLSLALGEDYDLLVVTGPNTGGKTVVLKTVGLLAALACCGLPVSAGEGSQLPLLSGLMADIGDQQSLESSLSTFSGHLQRIVQILAAVQPGTLVLLDELGTGTDPEEGAAIGQAVLEHLLARGALTIANTHLGQLKLFSLDVGRAENASMEFDPATLAPSFRLMVGVPGASHAIEVAEHFPLPDGLLDRARALARRGDGAEDLLVHVGRVRRDAEVLRERAEAHEQQARQSRRRVEEDEELSRHRATLRENEAEEAFLQLRRGLLGRIHEHAASLAAGLARAEQDRLRAFLADLQQQIEASELGRRWEDFLKGLKKGDVVYVPRLRDRLRVEKILRQRQTLKLRGGNLSIELPWREITWVEPPPGDDP